MSGTESEAVQAGARVMAKQGGFDLDDLQRHARPGENVAAWRANWIAKAQEVHDAMREIIAREVIAGVCRREGHRAEPLATLGDGVWLATCERCGEQWPLPKLGEEATGGPVLYDFPEPGGCFIPTTRPGERSAEILKSAAEWMKVVQFGPTHTTPIDWQAVIASWVQLHPFPVRFMAGIPAPEPCPFDCDTGPLGRDQLNAHIAQQHPDARSVQSVLGEDDPRSES